MDSQFNILYGQTEAGMDTLSFLIFQEMKFLHQISQKLSEKMPLNRLLSEIMESSKLVVNAEASSLLLFEPQGRKLYFQTVTGEKAGMIKNTSVKMGQGIAGWVAKNKKSLLIEDCYQDSRFNQAFDRNTNFRTRSMICVPLLRKNKLLGVMQVINKKGGEVFKQRDLIMFETLASQCAIAIENARLVETQIAAETLRHELEMARDIQQQILPERLPDFTDLDVAARLAPAEHVGGDYYNVVRLDNDHTLFIVADVTGKGIPAALLVSTLHSSLLTYFNLHHNELDLLDLLNALNKVLMKCTGSARFVTCWFGLYHHHSCSLTSVNAGHNPIYLFTNQQAEPVQLGKGGLFLGVMDLPYEQETIQMNSEDVIIFYSDGVTEAWNSKEQVYGDNQLLQVVQNHFSKSAKEILDAITMDIKRHVGRAQQSDDITCGVIKVTPHI